MYNTLDEWVGDIPIYSKRTIQQHLLELEALHLIHVNNFNKFAIDQTKWYTVNRPAFVAFINLWNQHGSPVRNGGNPSDEYQSFIDEWEKISGKYTLKTSGHDAEVAPCNAQNLRPLDDAEVASPLPDNTEDTTDNSASAEKSTDTVSDIYAKSTDLNTIRASVKKSNQASDPARIDESLSRLAHYTLKVTQTKKLSNTSLRELSLPLPAWDYDKKEPTFIGSAEETFDSDKVYEAWVDEVVVPRIIKRFKKVGITQFLQQIRNYQAFQDYLLTPHGKAFAQRVQLGIGALTVQTNDEPTPVTIVDIPGMD
jgi:hypothetical protein